jgi:phosphate-selective porin OprO and OprP
LNWYPNNALRVLLNYQNVEVDRLSPGGGGFPAAGTDIGQDIDTIALRLQVAL